MENLGKYATRFYGSIRDHKNFIEPLKSGDFHPVMRKDGTFKNIDYYYEDHIVSNVQLQPAL